MNKKIFSEAEVSAILQKAVEIQERDSATAYSSGVTIEELQRIAREVGISDGALEAALTQPAEESRSSFLNLIEVHERVFEGELDINRLDEVVEVLGEGVRFQVMPHVGRTLKAQVTSGSVFGTLELSSRNGRTKLKFRQTPFIAYFLGLHVPLILSVVMAASMFARGMPVQGLIATLSLLAVGVSLFSFIAQGGKRKARKMVDRMADQVGALIAEQEAAVPVTAAPVLQAETIEQRLSQGS